MPTISPARTAKLTDFTRGMPKSSATTRSATSSSVSPGCAGPFSTRSSTRRPTISSASSSGLVPAVSSVATISPCRITDTVSVIAMISRSLWVMRMMVLPCWRSVCSTRNRSSASFGVRTPVGSSRISTSAPRYSAFRISTRCCCPTETSSTMASGSTSSEYSSARCFSSRRALSRLVASSAESSAPSIDVVEHRSEIVHQHEVLVDHADAVPDRVAWRTVGDVVTGVPFTRMVAGCRRS